MTFRKFLENEQQNPIMQIAAAFEKFGWKIEKAAGSNGINPNALSNSGRIYPTIVSPDGIVKMAFGLADLYFHKERAWKGDSYEWSPDRVTLEAFVVSPEGRKQGNASQALQLLHSIVDKLGIKITGEPMQMDLYKGKGRTHLTTEQLKKWYMRHGWVPRYGDDKRILEYRPKDNQEGIAK